MAKINVQQTEITILKITDDDYISLTDIARFKTSDPFIVVCNWMRNRNTIEYLGIWETLYNPNFKPIEFEGFKKPMAILPSFMPPTHNKRAFGHSVMSPSHNDMRFCYLEKSSSRMDRGSEQIGRCAFEKEEHECGL